MQLPLQAILQPTTNPATPFHPWTDCGIILTRANPPDQQKAKTSAFTEVLTLIVADHDHLSANTSQACMVTLFFVRDSFFFSFSVVASLTVASCLYMEVRNVCLGLPAYAEVQGTHCHME